MMGLSNITVLYAILAVTSLCAGVSSTSLSDNSSTVAVDRRYTKPLGVNKGIKALTNISSNRIINGDENDADGDDGNDSGDGDTDDGDGDEDDGGNNTSPTAATTAAPSSKVTEATSSPTSTGTPAPTAAKPAPPAPAPAPTPDSSHESNTYRLVLSSILLTVWCIVLIIFFWTLRAEIPAFLIKVWMHLRTHGIKGCCSCFRRGGSNSSDGGNLNDIIFDPEEEQRNSLSQQLLSDE
jgi:hypothetical protein